VVTGSNTGVGLELAAMLYSKNAKVYVAARSKDKSIQAIETIKNRAPKSKGSLEFLALDLADLTKIKVSAAEFLSKESRLDVLFNNAGVLLSRNAEISRTPQGYELHLGTNNVGTFLFTKLLTPILVATAKQETPGAVRVVWVSSTAAEVLSHKPGGVPLDNLDYHNPRPALNLYGNSKAGNYLHATEFAKRHRTDGIVSVALHPGNLDSDLYRDQGAVSSFLLRHSILYAPVFGAYTELFAGLSHQVSMEKTGSWSRSSHLSEHASRT
jgi:retinol dehydrogenase-12